MKLRKSYLKKVDNKLIVKVDNIFLFVLLMELTTSYKYKCENKTENMKCKVLYKSTKVDDMAQLKKSFW